MKSVLIFGFLKKEHAYPLPEIILWRIPMRKLEKETDVKKGWNKYDKIETISWRQL